MLEWPVMRTEMYMSLSELLVMNLLFWLPYSSSNMLGMYSYTQLLHVLVVSAVPHIMGLLLEHSPVSATLCGHTMYTIHSTKKIKATSLHI